MGQARDTAGNIWETDAAGNATRLLQPAPQQGGGLALGGPDQIKINNDRRAEDANARATAAAERAATNQATQTQLDREKFDFDKSKGKPKNKEQNDAIAAYKAAGMIDGLVAKMEKQYKDGPGATSGFKGLKDYFPTTPNVRFDQAGSAVRGQVGTALAFTGGQLNTEREAAASIGPYLPQSGDRDVVILDKIDRLKDLARLARERSTAQLGGVPDVNGNIKPVADDTVSRIATGATKDALSPAGDKLAMRLLRANMSNADINAAMVDAGKAPLEVSNLDALRAAYKKNPSLPDATGAMDRAPTSVAERMLGSPGGAFATNYLDAASGGIPSLLAGQEGRDKLNELSAENWKSSLGGGALGGLTASLGLGKALAATRLAPWAAANAGKAALATDGIYGSTYGFNTANDGNGALGAALGGGGAILGNRIGAGAVRGLGGVTRGVVNPAVDYLRAQGVPLTGGQIAGGLTKRIEDTLGGYGLAGAPLRSRLTEGLEALNRAGNRIGGQEIGHTGDDVGRAGLDALQADKATAYTNSLNAMNLTQDADYQAARALADAKGAALPDALRPTFDATMQKADSFVQPGGYIPGQNAQAIKQTIREESRAHKGAPGGQFMRDALGEADGAFMGMAQRQTPAAYDLFRRADLTHGRAKVLEKAVDAASGKPGDPGLWAGSQLASALKGANVTQDARHALRPLAENAVSILPSQVPDSGTAGRLALGAFAAGSPLAALGYMNDGVGGAAQGETAGVGMALALASLNTKAGRSVLERALLSRPDAMRTAGNYLTGASPYFGALGRGAGVASARILGN